MRTHVKFDEGTFELTEQAATAFAGYSMASGWSIRVSLGALLDGTLAGDSTHDLHTGVVGAVGVARQWTLGDGYWFINGSAGVSIAATSTHEMGATDDPRLIAGDVRVGVMAGRTFAQIWSPYVLARAFGGPVSWTLAGNDTVGSDTRHFQLGVGLSIATELGLTIVADISLLGEQAASLGVSWRL
jgi:hypothetical protein